MLSNLRAEELYTIYQDILYKKKSKVSIRTILLEEKGHLYEMQKELEAISLKDLHIQYVCKIESSLCQKWLQAIQENIDRFIEK